MNDPFFAAIAAAWRWLWRLWLSAWRLGWTPWWAFWRSVWRAMTAWLRPGQSAPPQARPPAPTSTSPPTAAAARDATPAGAPAAAPAGGDGASPSATPAAVPRAPREAVREATREAARRAGTAPAAIPGADTAGTAQAQWLAGSHASGAGARDYRLYVPAGTTSGRPLLVMLHGCKQDPDDFALGTHMNALAGDARGWLVLYPAQSRRANRYGCWNWFRPVDQQRRGGEPEILAGMVEQVIAAHACDRARVFVAGLSAGGAMACVLAHTHPELFAAVGVHSGVPFASAHDAMSAMHAMKHGHRQVGMWPFARHGAAPRTAHGVPMIVFHGDADEIVHPRNGEQLVEQALGEAGTAEVPAAVRGEAGEQPGGHAYTRLVHDTGTPGGALEHWVVHGAGHAWSGGDENGSFTDPYGPNASTAMLRFFDAAGGAPARPARSPTDSYVH